MRLILFLTHLWGKETGQAFSLSSRRCWDAAARPALLRGGFTRAARTQPGDAAWPQCDGTCVLRGSHVQGPVCGDAWGSGEPALGRAGGLTLCPAVEVQTFRRRWLLVVKTTPASEPVQGARGSSALGGCLGCCSEARVGGTWPCWGDTSHPGWAPGCYLG